MEVEAKNAKPRAVPNAAGADERYFKLFRDYEQKATILAEVERTFLEGIELFAGRKCRQACERAGLSRMHLHYPDSHVGLLEGFVNERLKRRMIEWSAAVGRSTLGFSQDFLVEDLLVVRIHYPHGQPGRTASPTPPPSLRHRVRYGFSSTLERLREAYDSRSAVRRPQQVLEYLRKRQKKALEPLAYRCHAPHKDSWLGQPIGSLSVWLAISGVGHANSMCMYPETFGVELPIGPARYLGSGYCLPKPTRPEIHDGELFVFSTDILHGRVVNVSGMTRVALTTRVDPGTPVFDPSTLWFVQRWYSANDVLAGRFRHTIIRGAEHCVARAPGSEGTGKSRSISIARAFRPGEQVRVADSSVILDGQKLAVVFQNERVVILRSDGQLRAFSGRCPHGGYHMEDGHHDDRVLTCPGHGLEFDVQTGESGLGCYRLKRFDVREEAGAIFLG